LKKEKKENRM